MSTRRRRPEGLRKRPADSIEAEPSTRLQAPLSHTIEDYLRVIYSIGQEGQPPVSTDIRDVLGVAASTVSETVHRMERSGLVLGSEGRYILLSDDGLAAAEAIVRRHMLAERFLTDILKLGWADVHYEAHLLEHAISPRIEQQIAKLLDGPTTCPHGNPIPGAPPTSVETISLADACPRDEFVINNLTERAEEEPELTRYLERWALMPERQVRIEDRTPDREIVTVSVQGGPPVALSRRLARAIRVRAS